MDAELREAVRVGDHDRAWRIRHRGARPLRLPIESVPKGFLMPLQCAHAISRRRPLLNDASETDMSFHDFVAIMLDYTKKTIDFSIVMDKGRRVSMGSFLR